MANIEAGVSKAEKIDKALIRILAIEFHNSDIHHRFLTGNNRLTVVDGQSVYLTEFKELSKKMRSLIYSVYTR